MSYTEISSSSPKARKVYSCEWCGQSIVLQEKHYARTYIFDGEFTSGRMHLECERAMLDTPVLDLEDGWSHGQFDRPEKREVST